MLDDPPRDLAVIFLVVLVDARFCPGLQKELLDLVMVADVVERRAAVRVLRVGIRPHCKRSFTTAGRFWLAA